MLETRIAELTAAVEALTKAIGGMQAPGAVEKQPGSGEITTKAPKGEVPNAPPTTPPPTPPTTPPTTPPQVTYDDVKRATNAVSKISREKAIAGLARFGVQSATKLAEGQWSGYVDYMTQVAAGEIDPEASHA